MKLAIDLPAMLVLSGLALAIVLIAVMRGYRLTYEKGRITFEPVDRPNR